MKRNLVLVLVCFLALVSVGCRVVSGGNYVLRSGETLSSDLMVSGGDARLEPGSRVTGSLTITGGSIDANGQIDGDVSVTGGSINFGSTAVVRGVLQKTGGGVNIAPGAQVRSGESAGARTSGRSIGNLVTTFGLIPLVFIVVVIILLTTRTSRGTVAAVTPTQPASDAAAVASTSGASTVPARGTGYGGSIVLAVLLIVLGILFLLQELLNVDVWHYAWPLVVIGAGLLLFAAMVLGGKSSGRLAMPGSIVTIIGIILLYQNTFDQFQSWAYAWALIFPTAVGVGRYIEGWWTARPELRERGIQETRTGLIIFVILAAFFELFLNLSGIFAFDFGQYAFPILLIVIGFAIIIGRLINWSPSRPTITPAIGTSPAVPKGPDQQPPAQS